MDLHRPDFWQSLDRLVAQSELRIDRPKGSRHPRYGDQLYPLDYGYLEGTLSGDGQGIDVWVGSQPERRVVGVICAVDLHKRDAEVKILLGCTPDEARQILALHNSGGQAASLLERPETGDAQTPMESAQSHEPRWLEWGKALQAIAQNGLEYSQDPFDRQRYEQVRALAAEILANGSGETVDMVRGLLAQEEGHATPKVDVRGVVFQDDAILLVKERADGLWTLPGGWSDVGETAAEGTAREVWEESGYRVRPVKLLALYDRRKHPHTPHKYHIYKVFFLCELVGGEPTETLETDGVGFFRENEIPPLSTGRVTAEEIARFFEHHRHPDLPTDFD